MRTRLKSIHDVAQLCYLKGVRMAFVSPGSRAAPLLLAFHRHPHLKIIPVEDERQAAFMGLGASIGTGRPVVLICTSGTAPLHYAPAVAEALYGQVPLIVLSADRPAEWIDQADGQTIQQTNLYGHNVKRSFSLPEFAQKTHPDIAWHAARMIDEAIDCATTTPVGPVHINVPLRKPLYAVAEKPTYAPTLHPCERMATDLHLKANAWNTLNTLLQQHQKALIVVGQHAADKNTERRLEDFSEALQIPVLTQVNSNMHGLKVPIRHAASYIHTEKALCPTLIISFGGPILSQGLKAFLREAPIKAHIALTPNHLRPADTLQHLTHHVPMTPSIFFEVGSQQFARTGGVKRKRFYQLWQKTEAQYATQHDTLCQTLPFSSLFVTQQLLTHLPAFGHLHIGNSMPIRYANMIGLPQDKEGVEVFANRGVCGIDGGVSTVCGMAMAVPHVLNVLLIGDMSFHYDSKCLLTQKLPSNVRILMLNDQGGGIFRLIKAATAVPELEKLFAMRAQRSAASLSTAGGAAYYSAENASELAHALPLFLQPRRQEGAILEVFISPEQDAHVFFEQIPPISL